MDKRINLALRQVQREIDDEYKEPRETRKQQRRHHMAKTEECCFTEQLELNSPARGISKRELQSFNHWAKLRPYPKAKDEQDELGQELFAWVMKGYPEDIPESLEPFAIMNGFSPRRFKQICSVNNYFRELYELAGSVVSQKVYHEWRYQKICKDYARDFLFENSVTFADRHRELQAIKNDDAKKNPGNITVVMQDYKECPEVPKKEEDEL
jgi:hypothetical protein